MIDPTHILKDEYQFLWEDPLHQTQLKFILPNLKTCEYSIWGD